MPFLRLILIYIVVIAAAFAIFNRDEVMQMTGLSFGGAEPEAAKAEQPEPVEPQQTIPDEEPAIAEPTATFQADLAKNLEQVRKAFWAGDAKKAGTLYAALAVKYDTNPNIQGEVGNFYYSQRRFQEAAKYFHKAGLLLIENGNSQQVMSIINALQNIAPDQAADLRARAAKRP